VSQNTRAIGYIGFAYLDETVSALALDKGHGFIEATTDNVLSEDYPLARPLQYYTNGEPTGLTQDYIDFVMSPIGQGIVSYVGYIPIADAEETDPEEPVDPPEHVENSIIIKGSDTVLPISQVEAEDFMMENPDASVTVIGGGSGVGIVALIDGEVEIAMTSRKIKESELQSATENGVNLTEHVIAMEGIAVVVNPQNPVANLTYTQLRGIFNGTISNWAEVGGENLPITVVIRDSSSGTYAFFQEEVLLGEKYRQDDVFVSPTSGAVLQEVAYNTRAIGYIGFAYLDETVSALALDNGQEFIEATTDNVLREDYPLARSLQYYTDGEPTGLTKDFIDYVMSPEGQGVVSDVGYIPVADAEEIIPEPPTEPPVIPPIYMENSIIIKGSDTVLPLSQAEAEEFMYLNPTKYITVVGGGSGVGIAALIDGEVEIAMTSRKIKESELQSATENSVNPTEHVIAMEGIAVVVNPQNPVANLTYTQLRGIFNGTISNWAEVGGENLPITVIIRDSSSGTYEFFKEEVLIDDEYRPDSITLPTTGAMVQEVSQNTRAIGYIGFAYLDETVSALALDKGHGFIEATEENVRNEDYPLARSLQYYTDGEPTGLTKEFIDFIMSTTGQEIIANVGYISIPYEEEEIIKKTTSSSNSGGSGSKTSSGGGSGTTGEDAENIVFKDVLSLYAGKDYTMEFDFDNEDNDIKYVRYDSLKNAGKIAVTIEVLDATSIFVDNEPTGIIYKNINIWVGKTGYATESNINNPVIGFEVSKKWIQENDIDSSTVSLNRYNGKEWEALNTKMIDSDENYFYFEAGTSGFSPFAISCETVSNEPVIEETVMKSFDDELINENVEEVPLEMETTVQKNPAKIMEIIENIIHFINQYTGHL
jgi:phosphate binding protein